MIIYFSGTGNSLATARKIAEAIGDKVMTMAEAVGQDLSGEECIGLVYPSYDFAPPPAVRRMLPQLQISPNAYVFVIITCGAQAGISSHYARRVLKQKGIEVAYTHKIRMPDCAGIAYKRNPNEQTWKFQKYASRMEQIIADVKARRKGSSLQRMGLAGMAVDASCYRTMGHETLPASSQRGCVCGMRNVCQGVSCRQYHHAGANGCEAFSCEW